MPWRSWTRCAADCPANRRSLTRRSPLRPVGVTVIGALRRFLPAFLEQASPVGRPTPRPPGHHPLPHSGAGRPGFCLRRCGRSLRLAFLQSQGLPAVRPGRHRPLGRRELRSSCPRPTSWSPSRSRPNCAASSSGRTPRKLTTCSFTGPPELSEKLAADKGCAPPPTASPPCSTPGTNTWAFIPTSIAWCPAPDWTRRAARAREAGRRLFSPPPRGLPPALIPVAQGTALAGRSDGVGQGLGRPHPARRLGRSALPYLGAYVARTALRDERLVAVSEHTVTFRWKNRDQATAGKPDRGRRRIRPPLPAPRPAPRGLRSIRYYGFRRRPYHKPNGA